MECLTLDAENAYLLCYGVKTIENRKWTLPVPHRVYIHTSSGLGRPWVRRDMLPKGWHAEYRAWRDCAASGAAWMERYHKLVEYELRSYGVDRLADVDLATLDPKKYCLLASSIVGWIDVDEITHGDEGPWMDVGCYHWHIADSGLLDSPIRNVLGKQRVWRYENG
jgi:hypothetical protein